LSDEYFDLGSKVSFVMKSTDYVGDRALINTLTTQLENNQFVNSQMDPVVTSWYDQFQSDMGSAFPATAADLYTDVASFLDSDNGTRFLTDFGREGTVVNASGAITDIQYSRISINTVAYEDARHSMDGMDSLRGLGDSSELDLVVHAADFIFTEQFRVIEEELFRNLLLAVVCIYCITSLLIAHPGAAAIVTVIVVITLVDVLGTAHYIGFTVNSVTAIYMILAIGLTVDYSAHVAHHFMLQQGTREERAAAAILGVGQSVLCGGTSTVVAVIVLGFSQTYIFQVFFYMFFLTCMYGLFHGLVFLPIVLANIGPAAFSAVEPHTGPAKVPS